MRVFEIDQWGVRAALGKPFDELDREKMTKGDAAIINRIGIGKGMYREVSEDALPYIGTAWLIPDKDYNAQLWKATYDSSD